MVQTIEEQLVRDTGYKRHAFNTLVSQKIGLIRNIPDTRNPLWVMFLFEKIGNFCDRFYLQVLAATPSRPNHPAHRLGGHLLLQRAHCDAAAIGEYSLNENTNGIAERDCTSR